MFGFFFLLILFFCQVLCVSFLLRARWGCHEDSAMTPSWTGGLDIYIHTLRSNGLILRHILNLCKPFLIEFTSWTLCTLKCLIKVFWSAWNGFIWFDTAHVMSNKLKVSQSNCIRVSFTARQNAECNDAYKLLMKNCLFLGQFSQQQNIIYIYIY